MCGNLFVALLLMSKTVMVTLCSEGIKLGNRALSMLQNVIDAFRILAYATSANATNEYIKIGEPTIIECVKRFCYAV